MWYINKVSSIIICNTLSGVHEPARGTAASGAAATGGAATAGAATAGAARAGAATGGAAELALTMCNYCLALAISP